MTNIQIKEQIKKSRIKQYEIANYIGVSEFTLCKWFHKPLSTELQNKILSAINSIKSGEAVD